jgi:hypothetical protein
MDIVMFYTEMMNKNYITNGAGKLYKQYRLALSTVNTPGVGTSKQKAKIYN